MSPYGYIGDLMGEHKKDIMGDLMSKHRIIGLLAVCVMMTGLMPGAKGQAAIASIGGLSRLDTVSDELLETASELLGASSMEDEYAAAYKKTKWKTDFNKTDLRYMACIIYAEARNMGFDAKAAVGNVVLNRMRDEDDWGHANTVHDVIYDTGPAGRWWGYQFSPVKDGAMKKALAIYDRLGTDENSAAQEQLMNECIEVAKAVFKGYKSVPDTYMYFNAYITKTTNTCQEKGWSYIVLDKHIYYAKTER